MQQNHKKFGKMILRFQTPLSRIVKRFILLLIPAAALIFIGIAAHIDPALVWLEGEDAWVGNLILFAGVVYLVFIPFAVKRYNETIYEGGLTYTSFFKKSYEIAFNNMGITDGEVVVTVTTRTGTTVRTNRRMHYLYMPTNFRFIPITDDNKKIFDIVNAEGTEERDFEVHGLSEKRLLNFSKFKNTLYEAHLAFTTKNLNAENIVKVTMIFGKELELTRGNLIYKGGTAEETIIPLHDICDSSTYYCKDSGMTRVVLNGYGRDKTELLDIPFTEIYNVHVLLHAAKLVSAQ